MLDDHSLNSVNGGNIGFEGGLVGQARFEVVSVFVELADILGELELSAH